ncbi:MAG: PAS domain-containing protein [Nitrospirae bacterium]|nr:PAS domain-containing protein [Nitrospirota bacterium]
MGNWDWDIVGNGLWWSDEIYRIFGLTPREFGATYDAFLNSVHPEDRESVTRAVNEALQDRKDYGIDHRIVRPDGTERIVHERGEVTCDEAGKPVRMIGTVQDITEIRRMETQLRQVQKMEAVGYLAGGLAHAFNNMLTAVLGYSELLMAHLQKEPTLRRFAEQIRKAAESGAALSSQLLAFSRKQVLTPEVLDLNLILTRMDGMVRQLIGEDIELRVVLDPGVACIRADRAQIEQMVLNLVANARDAIPDGGRVTLETRNVVLAEEGDPRLHAPPGPYVTLTVSDSGTGMDPETRAHLFEPFFTTKDVDKGTGLGLYTVYNIATQSGGRIDVESEPGQGTVFRIYFPRVEGKIVPEIAEEVTPHPPVEGRETVLVVEDDGGVREFLAEVLRMRGFAVLQAENGREALRISVRHTGTIHLVVTDVVMPQMSGPELIQQLSAWRPGIRVLYISGYTGDAFTHRKIMESGTPFLQKPFSPATLARKVREVLDAK